MKKLIALLINVAFCISFLFSEPVNADSPSIPSGEKPKDRPSVCLVLAGGGSRGFAHLPVIRVIEEIGIPVDMVVGTSIGAIVGGVYCSGYSVSEIENELNNLDWTKLINDSATSPYEKILDEHSLFRNIVGLDFNFDLSLNIGKGISNGQNIYSALKELTLKYPSNLNFNDMNIPFRAVVTDMLDGEAYVLSEGDVAEAIRASMSIPTIFEPIEMDGHYFIDGGIRYNLAINVAKNMGYDIIIGVDISQKVRDNPETFNSNPLVAMLNTITIGQYVSTSQLVKEADLVIYPETGAYGTLDFKKGKEIYQKGLEASDLYKSELEEIRKRIFPEDYDENGNRISEYEIVKNRGVYRRKANLIPTSLEIEGAFPRDEKYIQKAFNKINDKELTPENFEEFIQSIYRTGNYISIIPRVFDDGENTTMKLSLKQADNKGIKIMLDAEMQQTFGTNGVTRFNFNPDFQVRGLTGSGSVMAVRLQSINNLGVSFYYMQPFNPNFFLQIDSSWLQDNYMSRESVHEGTDKYNYISGTSFSSWRSNLNFGFRTDNGNLIKTNFFFDYGHTRNLYEAYLNSKISQIYGEDSPVLGLLYNETPAYVAGVRLLYTLDTMNRSTFAHKGFFFNSMMECIFPFGMGLKSSPSALASIEMRGAIPLGKRFSFHINGFAGNEFTDTLINSFVAIPLESFTYYDRVYFPQVSGQEYYGTKKYAAMTSLQFEPLDDLTIFGGGLIFRLSGTAGSVVYTYDQLLMKNNEFQVDFPIMWTGSIDVGIRLKDGFNILLRGGVGSTYFEEKPLSPFIALDIGSTRF